MKTFRFAGVVLLQLLIAGWFMACDKDTDPETPDTQADITQDAQDGESRVDVVDEELEDITEEVVAPTFPLFAAPEGVVVVKERVFVTNTNGFWDDESASMVYGTGYVTVLDRGDLSVVGQVATPYVNPQLAVEAEGNVVVACSGTVGYDANWMMTPMEDGGVVVIDPDTLEVVREVEIPAGEPEALAGFPGSMTYDPDHMALFLASGTAPYVYKVNLETGELNETTLLYAGAQGNDAVVVEFHGGYVHAISFNEGLVYKVDPVTMSVEGEPVDITSTNEVEGAVDAVAKEGMLYTVLTLSSKVSALDFSTGEVTQLFTTGASPNRIVPWGTSLYVVNSMDNNLTKWGLDTQEATTPFAVFEPLTNPWEMASDADGNGFVTGYLSNNLIKVSLETGEVLATATNE